MHAATAALGALLAAGCARPAPSPAPPPPPPPPRTARSPAPASERPAPTGIDPAALPVWATANDPLVELWAVDADRVLLAAALLDPGELVQPGSLSYGTGRIAAASRRAAADAIEHVLLWRPGQGAAPIDVALYHEPRAKLSEILGRALGLELVWLVAAESRETIFASQVSAKALLDHILASRGLTTVRDGRALLIVDQLDAKVVARMLVSTSSPHQPRLDVAADNVKASYVAALVGTLVPSAVLHNCVSAKIALGLRDASVERVLARLATRTAHGRYCPQLEPWDPEQGLRDSDRVAAIATAGTESAALLDTGGGVFLLRPGRFSHGKITIQSDTVLISYGATQWSSSLDLDTLAARDWDDTPLPDDHLIPVTEALPHIHPKTWRVAATLREAAHWRALVVSNGLAWAWLDSSDPNVSIEPGRVTVQRDGINVELLLRGVKD